MVCCSWEGGGVSLPVVTLSNDVLCTAPSTHPLHHSTMHNAQNVLKCTFLYPPTVAALPRKQSVHNAANTSWSTLRRCTVCVHCTHQKSKSIVLPPCRPMLYSSTAILLLGAPLESVAAMWNPPACSYLCWFALGRGRKGSRYSDICAGAICTTQHTDTHGLTTCVCTHTHRYLCKHIATCTTHKAQQHAHKTETHGRTNNKKPESYHKQPQCLNIPRNGHSQHSQPANNTKKPENHTV